MRPPQRRLAASAYNYTAFDVLFVQKPAGDTTKQEGSTA